MPTCRAEAVSPGGPPPGPRCTWWCAPRATRGPSTRPPTRVRSPRPGPAKWPPRRGPSGALETDAWVDITTTIDVKAEALACHRTQMGDAAEWLRTIVRQRAEDAGRSAGVRYAEGFRRIVLAG